MISTEIYIEDNRLDLLQDISTEFTYTIDDITDFGTKNTSFSKTISLSGTARNNQIFGFVFDIGNANEFDETKPNVNYNFNASKSAKCIIYIDKVQIFKGTLRILEIVVDKETIEYQCSVFGELGGLMSTIGNKKLEDLDFSSYDHVYNTTNITASWDAARGEGYYYPLIDYGNVSTNKVDFQYTTFRPAIYIKEYIDKMFENIDYTYECDFFSTDYFKRLVIPHNQKQLTKTTSDLNNALLTAPQEVLNISFVRFTTVTGSGLVPSSANSKFTYTGATSFNLKFDYNFTGTSQEGTFSILKNGITVYSEFFTDDFFISGTFEILMIQNDYIQFRFANDADNKNDNPVTVNDGDVSFNSISLIPVALSIGDNLLMNDCIPKGIFQRDLFLSICKMFNLYVYDDRYQENNIIIKPYIDFYDVSSSNANDWSNKIDRSKPLSIKPMSEINARYYNFKFKEDSDFYNDNYKKKYSESYGDRLYDSSFDFSKDTETVDVIFAPSVLFRAIGTDKIYPAIYKKSNANSAEDSMDSIIRIMQVKKIASVASWSIKNISSTIVTLTSYGYAGHLDDPYNPDNDINFGAPKEIFYTSDNFTGRNVFNVFHLTYMAEITDKNSKLLTCSALLNTIDIFNLDFSKYIWIDGVLFRLNKVEGYNPMEYNTTKISLLKVIETTY
jgi:hypothetical protein